MSITTVQSPAPKKTPISPTRAAEEADEIRPQAKVRPDHLWRRVLRSGRVTVSGGLLLLILLLSVITLIWTMHPGTRWYYDDQRQDLVRMMPNTAAVSEWFGTDQLGRSMLARCLMGGAASLAIGIIAAALSVFLGVTVGLISGYRGGWIDSVLMRCVDVLYGLPYLLLVILLKIALEQPLARMTGAKAGNFIVLFLAIGLVSWLTMARVVRGQVLSLRSQPFIEACRAAGLPQWRIFMWHLLPNLIGPIVVYATLIVPSAILNESFLSFLGIGIQPPVPTWGALASDGLQPALNPVDHKWWMLLFPCLLLAITLLCLNFVGDGLRDVFDPKRDAAKI
jgi:oligopeptide transport system permease protein